MQNINFSVSELLNNLGHLNRKELIDYLKGMRESHLINERKQHANKISRILAVVESGLRNPIHLTQDEFQSIRPTMLRFVHQKSLDEGNFNMIFSD